MGYRSDVAYIIAGPTAAIQELLIRARMGPMAPALEEVVVSVLMEDEDPEEEVCAIGFQADDVKWYESYEDVKTHEGLWALAMSLSDGDGSGDTGDGEIPITRHLEGSFCIIGEDTGDIKERTFGDGSYELWEYLSISRSLSIDFDTDKSNDVRKQWRKDPAWRAKTTPKT